MQNTGSLQPEYQNYECQKCFIGHSVGAEWCEDLQSPCAEVLPKFNLEPWYAADHFTPTQTLRDKVVELIANSRFGIYDISSWKDKDGNWQLPRNIYIELGIAIALNRPTLLLRHTSNQELQLPTCLQGIKLLDFAGDVTLKKALETQLPQWINVPPDRDWLNRFCIFGNQVCSFREKHPCTQQWVQEKIHCHISDGLDKNHPHYHQSECDEIRGAFEDILNRYSDLVCNYLDEISVVDSYQYLLCSHCQAVRSSPFAIYRILPNTSAETFIAIGISIALEKLFEYKIPKVILVKHERDLPSLLRGYEVVEAVNSKQLKQKLKAFLPIVLKLVRETKWKPKILPFTDTNATYSPQIEGNISNLEEAIKIADDTISKVEAAISYDLKEASSETTATPEILSDINLPGGAGLAPSQARLFMLISRKRDLEFQAQSITQERMNLANAMRNLISLTSKITDEQPLQTLQNRIEQLQQVDKILELQLNRIYSQSQAIESEINAIQKVISRNTSDSFTFLDSKPIIVEGIAILSFEDEDKDGNITNKTVEITPDELDWEASSSYERQMGTETAYAATYYFDGGKRKIEWTVWEYPMGVTNYSNYEIEGGTLIQNFSSLEVNNEDRY